MYVFFHLYLERMSHGAQADLTSDLPASSSRALVLVTAVSYLAASGTQSTVNIRQVVYRLGYNPSPAFLNF